MTTCGEAFPLPTDRHRSFFLIQNITMSTMVVHKTAEKVVLWMYRKNISGQQIAEKIGITRQAWSGKLRNNTFTPRDIMALRSLGFEG